MKLYWSSRSPYVRKVMVVAHETGLAPQVECERVVVSAFKPNTDMLPVNPLGKIPTLVLDDATAIYDSRVICEYLDDQSSKPPLFPADGPARLQALTWQAQGDGMLDLLILRLYEERVREPGQRSDELLASVAGKLKASLDALARRAGELAAAPFGIGQIAVGCALSYMDFRFADDNWRDGRTALADWHAGFDTRPAVVDTEHADVYS